MKDNFANNDFGPTFEVTWSRNKKNKKTQRKNAQQIEISSFWCALSRLEWTTVRWNENAVAVCKVSVGHWVDEDTTKHGFCRTQTGNIIYKWMCFCVRLYCETSATFLSEITSKFISHLLLCSHSCTLPFLFCVGCTVDRASEFLHLHCCTQSRHSGLITFVYNR